MASQTLSELIQRAEALTPEEQTRLVAHLLEKARPADQAPVPRRSWREIRGAAPYPLLGEDAQAWVSRTRREDEENRERHHRRSA